MNKAVASARTGSFFSFLSLFTSFGTLICCALPALLVSLGMGATLAGVLGEFPQLIWLSENKSLVFGVAGTLLFLSGFLIWKNRNAPCPLDANLRNACLRGRKYAFWTWLIALAIYGIGAVFAFLLPYL